MLSSEPILITKVRINMATKDDTENGNLTPSSSVTFIQSQSPVSQATMSAFEITSVSDSATLEGEETEAALSKDADEMKIVLEKDSNRLSSSSGDSENVNATDSPPFQNNVDHLTGETHTILSNVPSNPSPKPPQDGNGPLQGGASRFRRVNQFGRGRWFVRDTHEPEERPESEAKMLSTHSDIPTNNSPSQGRKYPPSSLTTSEYSFDSKIHSRSNSEASFVTEQHVSFLPRDIGTLSDKSFVMADTNPSLSRTESNSSLITKSLDEDGERENRSRDTDLESIASIPNTHTPDLQSASGTYTSIEQPSQKPCDFCSKRNIQDLPLEEQCHAVETTMELLKAQLSQLLQNNSPYQSLLKEKEQLLKENSRLKERIKELESTDRTISTTNSFNNSSKPPQGEVVVTNHSNPPH